jgi:hypothetical protein
MICHHNPRLPELIGAKGASLCGRPLSDLVAKEQAARVDAVLAQARSGAARVEVGLVKDNAGAALGQSRLPGRGASVLRGGHRLERHLAELVNKLLDLGTIASGRLELTFEQVDLADAKREYVSAATRGLTWVALGEKDRGYALLAQACAEADWRLRDAKVNPLFDTLRAEPRFHELLKCIHLE